MQLFSTQATKLYGVVLFLLSSSLCYTMENNAGQNEIAIAQTQGDWNFNNRYPNNNFYQTYLEFHPLEIKIEYLKNRKEKEVNWKKKHKIYTKILYVVKEVSKKNRLFLDATQQFLTSNPNLDKEAKQCVDRLKKHVRDSEECMQEACPGIPVTLNEHIQLENVSDSEEDE